VLGLARLPSSIPSPASGAIGIFGLQLRAYGLMIALGIIAAVWLFGRRLEQKGWGTKDDAGYVALWAVIAGVIGARLYHVVTDWHRFDDNLGRIPQIWNGGLGIPGGLLLGIPVGIWAAKRRGIAPRLAATAAAPALPLAQAIGRWGNWWNQELFGRATDLPWGLEIDDDHLPAGYAPGTLFHPTFLYESLGNVALCGLLLWIDKHRNPRPGRLMAMYLMGYAVLRFFVESLRIDPANEILGLRVNSWMSILVFAGSAAWLAWESRHPMTMPVAVDALDDEAIAGGSTMDATGDTRDDVQVEPTTEDPD
jgi:prolipoprotein diacylglyceryl transferase